MSLKCVGKVQVRHARRSEEGKVDLQPYNYYDHDAAVIVDSKKLLEIVKGGRKSQSLRLLEGKMRIDGNLNAVTTFTKVKVNKPVTAEEKVLAEGRKSL
ncbi:MAG: hypothetical protein V8S38_07090 [Lachnospiraceae bacterium]